MIAVCCYIKNGHRPERFIGHCCELDIHKKEMKFESTQNLTLSKMPMSYDGCIVLLFMVELNLTNFSDCKMVPKCLEIYCLHCSLPGKW